MAFGTSSKIFSAFVRDALNITAAFDLDTHVLKSAIYGNTGTPDQTVTSANTAYAAGQWVTGNEVANGGWSVGGLALGTVTSGFAANVYTLDAADSANGSAATIADSRGVLIYDDTLTTPVADQGIAFLAFGGIVAVAAGTLTVQYNAAGILTLTL